MAQLPCMGLSWPLSKPPFGGCAIYFHYCVSNKNDFVRNLSHLDERISLGQNAIN